MPLHLDPRRARTHPSRRVLLREPPPPPPVPGCNCIYQPTGHAWEYAPLAASPYRGCGHGCKYCYVPGYAVTNITRAEFDAGAVERSGYRQRLPMEIAKYQAAGITDQVLITFTSDAYHPGDTSATRFTMIKLIDGGMAFCALSKGGQLALRDIDLYRIDRDCYAVSLMTLDNAFSVKWEPFAALPADRIATLQAFAKAGFFVWVSLEPIIRIEDTLAVIDATYEFVDHYKVGPINHLGPSYDDLPWGEYTGQLIDAFHRRDKSHYIKADLWQYLPPGYHNPMRLVQHR